MTTSFLIQFHEATGWTDWASFASRDEAGRMIEILRGSGEVRIIGARHVS